MISRIEEAKRKKSSGQYNCAQAVACTYADLANLSPDDVARMTAAFGTGMGSMDGTCGALVGAGLIVGLVDGNRVTSRAAMKDIMDAFNTKNGATVCRQLKGVDSGKCLRGCDDCVADAASLLERFLASRNTINDGK